MALKIHEVKDYKPKLKTDIAEYTDIFVEKNLVITHIKIDIKRVSHFTVFPEVGKTECFFVYKGKLKTSDGRILKSGDLVTYTSYEDMLLLENCEIISVEVTDENFVDNVTPTELRNRFFELSSKTEEKDVYTYGHCNRIRVYSTGICKEANVFPDGSKEFLILEEAAYIHDIGKTMLPLEVLNKSGKLTYEEFEEMKKHSFYGKEILLTEKGFETHALIVEQHHEKLDGSGYPYGLKGDEILISAQIITVADIFDALTTRRPYKPALPVDKAFEILRKEPINQTFVDALETYISKYSTLEQLS